MSSIEVQLSSLEKEANSLKTAMSRAGSNLALYHHETSISFPENTEIYDGAENEVRGRVTITYTTTTRILTIAELYIDNLGKDGVSIRRVPYSYGARWVVIGYSGDDYKATVRAMLDGEIEAS